MDKSPDAFRTISEAADELDLPQHVLRFWETRFSTIKPLKRGGGRRYYRPEDVLLPVQRALLTLCAAQGEMLAVLGLPRHYGESAALAHVRQLARLVGNDDRTLSFGALYHPWLIGREPGRYTMPQVLGLT